MHVCCYCWVYPLALVHSLLPLGAFGTYDIAARAAITGAAAGVTSLAFFLLSKRWGRSSR